MNISFHTGKTAMIAQAQVELRCAVANAGIKCNAQLGLLDTGEGQTVISDKHFGHSRVKRLEPLDLSAYLPEFLSGDLPV